MSWSRFGWSDLYTFPSTRDGQSGYECCACSLMPAAASSMPGTFWTISAEVFVEHITHHRDANHDVPAGIEDDVLSWAHGIGAPQ